LTGVIGILENMTDTKTRRIFLVDDESVILQTLSMILSIKGYEIVAEQDSGKAAEFVQTDEFAEFDLMISDVRMDPVNGLDLLKIAKEKHPGVPVIMLSAFGTSKNTTIARELGASEFLHKPFKPNEVLAAVARALPT
jgi:DNA-binding NtrC family response regulator